MREDYRRQALHRGLRRIAFALRSVGRAFMSGERRYARPVRLPIDGAAYRRRAKRRRP